MAIELVKGVKRPDLQQTTIENRTIRAGPATA